MIDSDPKTEILQPKPLKDILFNGGDYIYGLENLTSLPAADSSDSLLCAPNNLLHRGIGLDNQGNITFESGNDGNGSENFFVRAFTAGQLREEVTTIYIEDSAGSKKYLDVIMLVKGPTAEQLWARSIESTARNAKQSVDYNRYKDIKDTYGFTAGIVLSCIQMPEIEGSLAICNRPRTQDGEVSFSLNRSPSANKNSQIPPNIPSEMEIWVERANELENQGFADKARDMRIDKGLIPDPRSGIEMVADIVSAKRPDLAERLRKQSRKTEEFKLRRIAELNLISETEKSELAARYISEKLSEQESNKRTSLLAALISTISDEELVFQDETDTIQRFSLKDFGSPDSDYNYHKSYLSSMLDASLYSDQIGPTSFDLLEDFERKTGAFTAESSSRVKLESLVMLIAHYWHHMTTQMTKIANGDENNGAYGDEIKKRFNYLEFNLLSYPNRDYQPFHFRSRIARMYYSLYPETILQTLLETYRDVKKVTKNGDRGAVKIKNDNSRGNSRSSFKKHSAIPWS